MWQMETTGCERAVSICQCLRGLGGLALTTLVGLGVWAPYSTCLLHPGSPLPSLSLLTAT